MSSFFSRVRSLANIIFLNKKTYTVQYNVPIKKVIFTAVAKISVLPRSFTARYTYYYLSGKDKRFFFINLRLGKVKFRKTPKKQKYEFYIRARIWRKSKKIKIIINVIPDKAAVFEQDIYSFILNNKQDGQDTPVEFGIISANDANGDPVTYNISDQVALDKGFRVNKDTGLFSYVGIPEYDPNHQVYIFNAEVHSSNKVGYTTMKVYIRYINEHPVIISVNFNSDIIVNKLQPMTGGRIYVHDDLVSLSSLHLHVSTDTSTPEVTPLQFLDGSVRVNTHYGYFVFEQANLYMAWSYMLDNNLSSTSSLVEGELALDTIYFSFSDTGNIFSNTDSEHLFSEVKSLEVGIRGSAEQLLMTSVLLDQLFVSGVEVSFSIVNSYKFVSEQSVTYNIFCNNQSDLPNWLTFSDGTFFLDSSSVSGVYTIIVVVSSGSTSVKDTFILTLTDT